MTGRRIAAHPRLLGRRLDAAHQTWIRFVLVPGLTDNPATIEPIADYAASLGCVSRVEVLPFHQMGRGKWAELGLSYELAETAAVGRTGRVDAGDLLESWADLLLRLRR
ncbi:MAG: hypothetical protein R2742_13500 [Micropruina glycogenica]